MIKTCFSPTYSAQTRTASMRKLAPVARAAEAEGLVELIAPHPISADKLRRLHNPKYVDAFMSGQGELASSQGWDWTPEIRDGVLAINGGQLKAAELAFKHGFAANIGQGFHHAGYEMGEGFCTFNGLALIANEYPDKKIFVLDCDEHGGNGTAEFTTRLKNLFNFSICGQHWNYEQNERSVLTKLNQNVNSFDQYKLFLNMAYTQMKEWQPDLVIYQAGVDSHINDPLSKSGMTTEQLMERDERVFDFCIGHNFPTFFVLAGGYQTPIETNLVPLHLNTFKAAKMILDGK